MAVRARKDARELERRHHAILRPPAAKLLDSVGDAATGNHPESVEREWRTCPVPAQSFATQIIFGSDSNAGVEVEAFMLDGASFASVAHLQ